LILCVAAAATGGDATVEVLMATIYRTRSRSVIGCLHSG
jgi:hypothetical protein